MLALIIGVAAVSNVMTNRVLPGWAYVPWSLAFAATLVLIAVRLDGASAANLGLARADVGSGLRWGGTIFTAMALVYVVGIALPLTRDLFRDRRATADTGELLRRMFLTVPFGTVLAEEVAFRGVILAAFRRRVGIVQAALWSSLLFGFWHVLPSWGINNANPIVADEIGGSTWGRAAAVIGSVIFTGIAGLLFCWLRERSKSLVAPIMLHLATNSLGYLGAYVVVRWF